MTAKTRKLVENLYLITVFITSGRVIETYVQRRQCFKSMKSSSCCYYILQEKEENSDIIVLFRHVLMFLYYITLMCLKMIRMCPRVRLGAQPVLDRQTGWIKWTGRRSLS